MALKPCPGGVSNVLFTIGSIDLGYCNVRGGGTAREKAANGDGQQQGQTRPHDPVNAASCPPGPCIQGSLSRQTCSTIKPLAGFVLGGSPGDHQPSHGHSPLQQQGGPGR